MKKEKREIVLINLFLSKPKWYKRNSNVKKNYK